MALTALSRAVLASESSSSVTPALFKTSPAASMAAFIASKVPSGYSREPSPSATSAMYSSVSFMAFFNWFSALRDKAKFRFTSSLFPDGLYSYTRVL